MRLEPASRLAQIFGAPRIDVNSFHHQAVDPVTPGRHWLIAASAEDGTVEALEAAGERFLLGVQWHPECLEGAHRRLLFGALISAAQAGPPPWVTVTLIANCPAL